AGDSPILLPEPPPTERPRPHRTVPRPNPRVPCRCSTKWTPNPVAVAFPCLRATDLNCRFPMNVLTSARFLLLLGLLFGGLTLRAQDPANAPTTPQTPASAVEAATTNADGEPMTDVQFPNTPIP